MLVCSVQRIFRSILVGKFILPRLQKYFRGTLYTYFESIWSEILSSLSSRLSSILMFTPVFVWLLPSSLLYKINFCVTFRKFLGKHLSMESEYLYTSFGVVVGIKDLFVQYCVMSIYLIQGAKRLFTEQISASRLCAAFVNFLNLIEKHISRLFKFVW